MRDSVSRSDSAFSAGCKIILATRFLCSLQPSVDSEMLGHIPEVLHALPSGRTAVRVFGRLISISAPPKGLSDLHHLGNRLFGDIWNRRVRGWEIRQGRCSRSIIVHCIQDLFRQRQRGKQPAVR